MREGGGCVEGRKGVYENSWGSGVGPYSVRVRVRGGVANRELGGGLVTTGGGCIVVGEGEDQTRPSGGMHGRQWGGSTFAVRWTLVEPGWLGTASGVRAASMGGKRMSKDFDIFGQTVRLARPIVTSLSQKMTVAGWGWPL
jgi:hypothetical protein